MALDFPNAPTLNQTVTAPNGVIWMWDGVKWTATTSTSPYVGGGNVGRNLLHNPLFNIAQRGTSFTATGVQAIYAADRWVIQSGAAGDTTGMNINPATDTDRAAVGDEAFQSMASLMFIGTAAAGSISRISQKIESVRRLSGKTVTVSFWAGASAANKLGVSIDQYFGTGGSPSASVVGNGAAVTLTTAWARYSVTLTIPSASGKTVGTNGDGSTILNIWGSAGSNWTAASGGIGNQGTWYVNMWGVQLEVGSVATPLEKLDPQYDLSNCQRFYSQGWLYYGGNHLSVNLIVGQSALPMTMRTAPTIILSGSNAGSNVSTVNVTSQFGQQVLSWAPITNTGYGSVQQAFTASADL